MPKRLITISPIIQICVGGGPDDARARVSPDVRDNTTKASPGVANPINIHTVLQITGDGNAELTQQDTQRPQSRMGRNFLGCFAWATEPRPQALLAPSQPIPQFAPAQQQPAPLLVHEPQGGTKQ